MTAVAEQEVTDDWELIKRVLDQFNDADQQHQPLPGRPALHEVLPNATEYQLKKAIEAAKAIRRHQLENPPKRAASADAPPTSASSPGEIPANPVTSPGDATNQPPGSQGDPAAAPALQHTAARTPIPKTTRLVTWGGFVFGATMSIAGNVLHTWLPEAHESPGWSPGLAPQIGAAVWPVSLVFAVEVLARVGWPSGLWWGLPRYVGTVVVAIGSWWISYGDVRDVLLAWNYQPDAAKVGPLVLDGLMIVCAFALLANSRSRTGRPSHQRLLSPPPPAPAAPPNAINPADDQPRSDSAASIYRCLRYSVRRALRHPNQLGAPLSEGSASPGGDPSDQQWADDQVQPAQETAMAAHAAGTDAAQPSDP